jgi:hypothetical protein
MEMELSIGIYCDEVLYGLTSQEELYKIGGGARVELERRKCSRPAKGEEAAGQRDL